MKWYQILSLIFTILLLIPFSPILPAKRYGQEHKTLVALTFDDGYNSWVHEAKPTLEKYELPATAFINNPKYRENFSVGDVKELKRGGWGIGWHTGRHTSLTNLNHSQTVKELTAWRDLFKGLSLPKPYSFSYPGGNYNDKKSEVVSNYFKATRTCDPGVNTPRWVRENPTKLRIIKEPSEMSVNFYEGNGVFLVYTFHDIGKRGGVPSISPEKFKEFSRFLHRKEKSGKIDVVQFKEGVKIMKKRELSSSWIWKVSSPFGIETKTSYNLPIPSRYLLIFESLQSSVPVIEVFWGPLGIGIVLAIIMFISTSIIFTFKSRLTED